MSANLHFSGLDVLVDPDAVSRVALHTRGTPPPRKRMSAILHLCVFLVLALGFVPSASAADTAAWASPADGSTIGGTAVSVHLTATADNPPVTGAICYAAGGYNVGTISTVVGDDVSGTLDVSGRPDGSTTIACDVYSNGGATNVSTGNRTFIIDNTTEETPPVTNQVFVCSSGTGTEEDPCVMSVELGPDSATFLVDLMYALGFLAGLAITIYCLWWLRGLWPGEKDAGSRADRMV